MIYTWNRLKDSIQAYRIWSERQIEINLKFGNQDVSVISVYAPEEGKEEESDESYEQLEKTIDKMNPERSIFVIGDLSARTGSNENDKVVGKHGEITVNKNGKRLIDISSYNNFTIMNGFYKHKKCHKITWVARDQESIIDYVVVNIHAKKTMLDVQVFRGYDIGLDHHLVEAAIRVNNIGKTTECRQTQLNINSLNDSVANWLYKRRMEIIEKDLPIEEDVEKAE
ncbi:craniofacial development protein 2-like [Planococcus citri]|uniref:craniofacial development protein 2-like n=1 Tax=Planococcus citri TaxID=170843 RepID=UPI0031F7B0FD